MVGRGGLDMALLDDFTVRDYACAANRGQNRSLTHARGSAYGWELSTMPRGQVQPMRVLSCSETGPLSCSVFRDEK